MSSEHDKQLDIYFSNKGSLTQINLIPLPWQEKTRSIL